MKAIGTFLIVICITMANAFLNGYFWMWGYELGMVPLINHLTGDSPTIPYVYFVLLSLGWSLLKNKKVDNNEATSVLTDKFWSRYFGVICTNFVVLGILYLLNNLLLY